MIDVNGMAHVILTVSQWEKAREFYAALLPFLGMTKVYDGNNFLYHVGGRTAIGIQRCAPEHVNERFVQNRVGMHHLCLRARSREDVDAAAAKLREMGAFIDRGPIEGNFAPGYYYIVFEDPDGIRLEINFVPGRGLLATPDKPLLPSDDPNWDQNPNKRA
jgi:catechol 2,3-dioxygenase-like lactoylglutathione lyase family enzyme